MQDNQNNLWKSFEVSLPVVEYKPIMFKARDEADLKAQIAKREQAVRDTQFKTQIKRDKKGNIISHDLGRPHQNGYHWTEEIKNG
jgi:hypothetical protein